MVWGMTSILKLTLRVHDNGSVEVLRAETEAEAEKQPDQTSVEGANGVDRVGRLILKWMGTYPEPVSRSRLARHMSPADRRSGLFTEAWNSLTQQGRIRVVGYNRQHSPVFSPVHARCAGMDASVRR